MLGAIRERLTCLGGLIGALSVALVGAAPAAAGTVSDAGDAGPSTLRGQVASTPAGGTVTINAGVNPTLTSGEIAFAKNLTIDGQGAGATTISGNNNSRIFSITGAGNKVKISDLTITAGRAPSGGIDMTTMFGNPGGDGGAILNAADLTLEAMTISASAAGIGGPGPMGSGPGGSGGAVGNSGKLTLTGATISGNFGGSGGGGSGPVGGQGGQGGGINNTGTLTVTNSTISQNTAGPGTMGSAIPGTGGSGGGIDNVSPGTATIVDSRVVDNHGGPPGPAFTGAGGSGGQGGGINLFGAGAAGVTVNRSLISGNNAGPSSGGMQGSHGGGINATAGTADVVNTTLQGNVAGAGGPSMMTMSGGSGGSGGGVAVQGSATITLSNATLAGNKTGVGGPGMTSAGPPGVGGGVLQLAGTLTVRNSILAKNLKGDLTDSNCFGTITNGGFNIGFPADANCTGFASGDPKLDPAGLVNNGGPTKTIALLSGSAAIDQIPPGSCLGLTTDQRGSGFIRPSPSTGNCDIGAFEVQQAEPAGPAPAASSPASAATKKCKKKKKKRSAAAAKKKCKKKKKKR